MVDFANNSFRLSIYLFLQVLSYLPNDAKAQLKKVNTKFCEIVEDSEIESPVYSVISMIPILKNNNFASFDIKQLSGGMTNKTYLVTLGQDKWVLRIGGIGTSNFIDRNAEFYNAAIASKYGINVPIEWSDPNEGLQLTKFFSNSRPFNKLSENDKDFQFYLGEIAKTFRHLHSLNKPFFNDTDIFLVNENYLKIIKEEKPAILPSSFILFTDFFKKAKSIFSQFSISLNPCHNDTTPSNFLVSEAKQENAKNLYLIDWEYSGNNDILWDLVYFGIESNLSDSNFEFFIKNYFDDVTPEIRTWINFYKPLVCLSITFWTYAQIANGSTSCDIKEYYDLANRYVAKTGAYIKSEDIQKSFNLLERMIEEFHKVHALSKEKPKFRRGF